MILSELASTRVITLTTAEPIARAVVVMQEEGIRHLIVLRARVPVGMISDHDILAHVGWLHLTHHGRTVNPAERVEKIMVSPLATLAPGDPVDRAAKLMLNKRIGAVPLVVEQRLVGIVTETDLLTCFTKENALVGADWRNRPLAEFVSRDFETVEAHEETLEAVRLMRTSGVRHLVVVEADRVVGMVSNRDILRGTPRSCRDESKFSSTSSLPASAALHVSGVMTGDVDSLPPTATLAEAASLMKLHKIGALPIMVDDELTGMITEADLLQALIDACAA